MSRILDLLFPPKCAACGVLLDWEKERCTAFCPSCLALWEDEKKQTCGICAKPVSECSCMTREMENARCASFWKLVYYLHGAKSPVQNRIIYLIKRTREKLPVRFLARELSFAVSSMLDREGIDSERMILTYIPRGARQKAQFGTDQAKVLAQALGEGLGIPLQRLLCRPKGQNRLQKRLSSEERRRNAKRAYRLAQGVACKGCDVLLVDDIVTTGATMAACARLLRRAGAERIFCIAIASDDTNRDMIL